MVRLRDGTWASMCRGRRALTFGKIADDRSSAECGSRITPNMVIKKVVECPLPGRDPCRTPLPTCPRDCDVAAHLVSVPKCRKGGTEVRRGGVNCADCSAFSQMRLVSDFVSAKDFPAVRDLKRATV
jgi:hypothetical protein